MTLEQELAALRRIADFHKEEAPPPPDITFTNKQDRYYFIASDPGIYQRFVYNTAFVKVEL